MIKTLVSCIALLSVAAPAAAANWTFNYTVAGGSTLSGKIRGTLQGDNNTVLVSSVSKVALNDVRGPATGSSRSITSYFGGPSAPAFVTLDGAEMDILACDRGSCTEGFFFITDPAFFDERPTVASSLQYGEFVEEYVSANWSMDAWTGAVPEPASWVMLIAGFGLTGAAMRRRRIAVVSA